MTVDMYPTLRALRVAKGMTQVELAQSLGTSQTTISSWEQGESVPSGKNIKKIADFYNVKPDVIFDAIFNKLS